MPLIFKVRKQLAKLQPIQKQHQFVINIVANPTTITRSGLSGIVSMPAWVVKKSVVSPRPCHACAPIQRDLEGKLNLSIGPC